MLSSLILPPWACRGEGKTGCLAQNTGVGRVGVRAGEFHGGGGKRGWSPWQLPLNSEATGDSKGGRLDGCLSQGVWGRQHAPGTLGIELFLFWLTCARPWGQAQESAACPGGAQPGVGMVHAASVRLSLPVCAHGASSPGAGGLLGCHAEDPGPKGGLGEQPDAGRSVGLGSGKLLEKVELTKIPRSFSQPWSII